MAAQRDRVAADTPRPLRAAIYTRKSSEEGLEQGFNSLHAQREACEAYILSQAGEGWTAISKEYDDGGFSGGNLERPGLKQMLTDIDAGSIDIVVVYKVDRLTRSLADFAKIVERFDAKGVSFVSVTQAFNTTTSMGRLTLNVLLSFAQFEREVTGERIRDKIAASKAKGMWMGGTVPLGYESQNLQLVINEAEAEQVRHIFRRYLELGSTMILLRELESSGVRSKAWTTKDGRRRGGGVIMRGALNHLLKNRHYIGEIVHRDKTYPGLHEPILPRELFDAVQRTIAENHVSASHNSTEPRDLAAATWVAPLVGLLRDSEGRAMTPTHALRRNRRYRYYVSSPPRLDVPAARIRPVRVSATEIETLIKDRAFRLIGKDSSNSDWTQIRAALASATLHSDKLVLRFARDALENGQAADAQDRITSRIDPADILKLERDSAVLQINVTFAKRRGTTKAISPDRGSPLFQRPIDLTLVKALGRAEAWRVSLMSGKMFEEIAKDERLPPTYVRRVSRLAFLAPDLKWSILEGTQPENLTLEKFMRTDLAVDWATQRAAFATG